MKESYRTIRARLAALPTEAVRVLVGVAFFAVGNGLTLPFMLVYLHEVRGLSTETAGLIIGWIALGGLVAGPAWGAVVDRVGPMPVLRIALLVEAAGVIVLAFVDDVPSALVAGTLLSLGVSGVWPSQTALLARLVPADDRQWLFGIWFMLLNLGIGVGGLIAALIVDVDVPGTFSALYLVNALTYLAYLGALLTLPLSLARHDVEDQVAEEVRGDEAEPPAEGRSDDLGYRAVLRDRTFVQLLATATVLVVFGYAQLEVGLAVYATQVMDLDPRWLGVAFALNTVTIVVAQLFVLARLEGRSRSRALAVAALCWGTSWAVLALSSPFEATVLLVVALSLTAVVFALGETLWSPTMPALVNDLAPDALRGRYNALSTLTWNVGGVLGPVFAGFVLGAGHHRAWSAATVLGCLLGALGALLLRRSLTAAQDGRPSAASATMNP
jgi:MFS family permease